MWQDDFLNAVEDVLSTEVGTLSQHLFRFEMARSAGKLIQDSKVPKRIHHVEVGAAVTEQAREHAQLWAKTNPGYTSTLWIDPEALMVDVVRNEISNWAEMKALKELGIASRAELNAEPPEKFFKLVAEYTNKKRYALQEHLKGINHFDRDLTRIGFAAHLHAETHGQKLAMSFYDSLKERLKNERIDAYAKLNDKKSGYKNLRSLLGKKEHADLRAAYLRELNLRQDSVAASDIARILVLKEKGGVYADLKTLPTFDDFEGRVREKLAMAGHVLPREDTRLKGVITETLTVKLGCRKDGSGDERNNLDPSDYFAPGDYEQGHLSADQRAELAEADGLRRQHVAEAVDALLGTLNETERNRVFASIGTMPAPEHGRLRIGLTGNGSVDNALIITESGSAIVNDAYKRIKMFNAFMAKVESQLATLDDASVESVRILIERKTRAFEKERGLKLSDETSRRLFAEVTDYMSAGIVSTRNGADGLFSGSLFAGVIEAYAAQKGWAADIDPDLIIQRFFQAQGSDLHERDAQHLGRPPEDSTRLKNVGDRHFKNNPDGVEYGARYLVIQLDDSDTSISTVRDLYNRYPDESISARFDEVKPNVSHFSGPVPTGLDLHRTARFFDTEAPVHLTFVGEVGRGDGGTTFGAMSVDQLVQEVRHLFEQASGRSSKNIVLELKAVALNQAIVGELKSSDFGRFSDEFARAMSTSLNDLEIKPDDIQIRVSGCVADNETHQAGTTSDPNARRSGDIGEAMRFVFKDGRYVRELISFNREAWDPKHSLRNLSDTGTNHIIVGVRRNSDAYLVSKLKEQYGTNVVAVESLLADATSWTDPTTGDTIVRDGFSRLAELDGDMVVTLVGAPDTQGDSPTLGGLSARAIAGQLDRMLAQIAVSGGASRIKILLQSTEIGTAGSAALFADALSNELLGHLTQHGIDPGRLSVGYREGLILRNITGEFSGVLTPLFYELPSAFVERYKQIQSADWVYWPEERKYVREPLSTDTIRNLERFVERADENLGEAHEAGSYEPAESEALNYLREERGAAIDRHYEFGPWSSPELMPRHSNVLDERGPSRYEHQLIVQFQGDDASTEAGKDLYSKHPNSSSYAQWRDDQLHFITPAEPDGANYVAQNHTLLTTSEGKLRLTLLGHGGGGTGFAGLKVDELIDQLRTLLSDGMGRHAKKLVINFVACSLDKVQMGESESFAGQFAHALPALLTELNLDPRKVEVHARRSVVEVERETGVKYSDDKSLFRFVDDRYVRQKLKRRAGRRLSPAAPELWHAPDLSDASQNTAIAGVTLDYERHLVVQLDGTEGSRIAASSLQHVRPDLTDFAQWRDGELKFLSPITQANAGGQAASPAFPKTDAALKVSFVGDVRILDGVTYYAGMTPGDMVDKLSTLLEDTVGSDSSRLSISFVGEGLDRGWQTGVQSFMDELAAPLAQRLQVLGIEAGKVEIVSEPGYHRPGDGAHERGFVLHDATVLPDELGDAYAAAKRAKFGLDNESGQFARKRADLNEMSKAFRELAAAEGANKLSGEERALSETLRRDLTERARRTVGDMPMTPVQRTVRDSFLANLKDAVRLRLERSEKILKLMTPEFISQGWRLVPELVKENDTANGKKFLVGLARPNKEGSADLSPDAIRWVGTDEHIFMMWKRTTTELARNLKNGIKYVRERGAHMFAANEEAGAVHTLNSAFMYMALMGPGQEVLFGTEAQAIEALSGRPVGELSAEELAAYKAKLPELKLEYGVNFAQQTMGLVQDAGEFAKIMLEVTGSAPTWAKGVGKASVVLDGLGVGMDIASVVFGFIDLANATTDRERAVATYNVSSSAIGLGVNVTAMGAGLAGASTVAGVLGALAVPLAGLTFGIGEVVNGYAARAENVEATLQTLNHMIQGVTDNPLSSEKQALVFGQDVVISGLDLRTGIVTYGDVRVAGVRDKGRLIAPEVNSDLMLDMYSPFLDEGKTRHIDDSLLATQTIVLPAAQSVDFNYDMVDSPGQRYKDYPLLDKFEAAYKEQFYWWTYRQTVLLFGWDYSPSKLKATFKDTPFALQLDGSSRNIVVPDIKDDAWRAHMKYMLVGGGGTYRVVLPSRPVDTLISAGSGEQESWLFDVTEQVYSSEQWVRSGILGNVTLSDAGLCIDGVTTVRFDKGMSKNAAMSINLGATDTPSKEGVVLLMSVVDGGMTFTLRVANSTMLDSAEVRRLHDRLHDSGMTQRIVNVIADDAGAGFVDFETNSSWLATYSGGATSLYQNGVLESTVQSSDRFAFGTRDVDGTTQTYVTYTIEEGTRVHATYVGGYVTAVDVSLTQGKLFDLAANGSLDSLLQTLKEGLPLSMTVPISFQDTGGPEGAMATARASRKHESSPWTIDDLTFEGKGFRFVYDRNSKRGTFYNVSLTHISRSDTAAFQAFFGEMQSLEIINVVASDEASTLVLSKDLAIVEKITISSVGALNLILDEIDVDGYSLDGGDIRFSREKGGEIVWLGADPAGQLPHTLQTDAAPPAALMQALLGLDNRAPVMGRVEAYHGVQTALIGRTEPASLSSYAYVSSAEDVADLECVQDGCTAEDVADRTRVDGFCTAATRLVDAMTGYADAAGGESALSLHVRPNSVGATLSVLG